MTTASIAAEPAPSTQAVDGINAKAEAFGGGYATKSLVGAAGSLSVPLASQFGAQLDAGGGEFANRFIGALGGHLFWRDPRQGLLGVYGDYTHWDQSGGVHVGHVGLEGEAYLQRWTLSAVAGVETGNNSRAGFTTIAIPGPGTLTTGNGLSNTTRFFDRASAAYYLTDNWKASIGHRYMGGKNALALGSEYAMPAGRGMMASLFAEGRLGEGTNNYGAWGGVRVYFGNSDKSLMRRHREDDPAGDFTADTLFNVVNGGSSGSTASCPVGEVFVTGNCVSPSDIRFKRDVLLLARLDNGIGIYSYRYLWSDVVYVGVMAQEVLDIVPDAVIAGADGFYCVNYARLGRRLMTWDEWTATQADMAAPLAA